MNKSYIMGFAVGIISVLIIAFVIRCFYKRKYGEKPCEFDERQLKERGKAFQTGFFTLLITIGLALCTLIGFEEVLSKKSIFIMLLSFLMIGVLVTTIQLIWTDCYISFRNKPTPNIVLFLLLSLTQIALYFIEQDDGEAPIPNLIVGISLFIVAINMIMKILYDKKHLLEDEESIEE